MAAASRSSRSRAYRDAFGKRYGVTYGEARLLSRQLFGNPGSPARAARLAGASQRGIDLSGGRGKTADIAYRAIVFRGRAANALADIRYGPYADIATAEAASGFAPGTLRAQFPTALRAGGRVTVADRESVVMEILSQERGATLVVTTSSDERKVVAAQSHAIDHYLRTGDPSRLEELEGAQVGGLTVETNPDVIEALDEAGQLPQGPYPQARGVA
jgi:hypothetical protein